MMQQRNGSSVGLASVLMIVMILALTCFGVLALTSARADAAVSERAERYSAAYYAAEGRLQAQLAELDADAADGPVMPVDGRTVVLTEPVTDGQELRMVVWGLPGERRYEVLSCELAHTGVWQPEEDAPQLWNGGN